MLLFRALTTYFTLLNLFFSKIKAKSFLIVRKPNKTIFFLKSLFTLWQIYMADIGLPWWLRGYSVCLQCGRPGFDSWVGKIPWRSKWQATPLFLPRESHGQRSLMGYSPQGRKESDMTERLYFHFHVI